MGNYNLKLNMKPILTIAFLLIGTLAFSQALTAVGPTNEPLMVPDPAIKITLKPIKLKPVQAKVLSEYSEAKLKKIVTTFYEEQGRYVKGVIDGQDKEVDMKGFDSFEIRNDTLILKFKK